MDTIELEQNLILSMFCVYFFKHLWLLSNSSISNALMNLNMINFCNFCPCHGWLRDTNEMTCKFCPSSTIVSIFQPSHGVDFTNTFWVSFAQVYLDSFFDIQYRLKNVFVGVLFRAYNVKVKCQLKLFALVELRVNLLAKLNGSFYTKHCVPQTFALWTNRVG